MTNVTVVFFFKVHCTIYTSKFTSTYGESLNKKKVIFLKNDMRHFFWVDCVTKKDNFLLKNIFFLILPHSLISSLSFGSNGICFLFFKILYSTKLRIIYNSFESQKQLKINVFDKQNIFFLFFLHFLIHFFTSHRLAVFVIAFLNGTTL